MNFLAPLFLLGALAVALPVVFHLIRRSTRRRHLFSSLMFLLPSPPRLSRRSRLEHLLLLLLRCAVVALLALAFARPFLRRANLGQTPPAASRRLLVLVDASASMRRAGVWAAAQAQAESELRRAGPADAAAVFTFDRELRPLVSFEEWQAASPSERLARAAAKLAGASPGWSATHLGRALTQAAEALADTGGGPASARGRIVLISDLQEGSRLEPLQGFEWPKHVEVSLVPVKAKPGSNAALQLVNESDDFAPAVGAGIRVRVSNAADSRREQFQVGWAQADGRSLAGTPLAVYVPPGQSRVVAVPLPGAAPSGPGKEGASSAGPAAGGPDRILLRGDDEDFDNTVFVVPPERATVSVLYCGSESERDSTQPLYFLRRAFQESRRQSVQVVARQPSGVPPRSEGGGATSSTNAVLSPADFQGAALAVVTAPLPEALAAAMHEQAAAGKTLLVALKNAGVSARALATLLGVERIGLTEAVSRNYAFLAEVDFRHPLFAPFEDPRYSDFTKIHFWKHRQVDAGGIAGARVLARFDDGDPALVEVGVGKGRVLLLTSGWQPEDSQLALSSKFVPLLYALLEYSGAAAPLPVQYHPGDVLPLPASGPGGEAATAVRAPDGSTVNLPAGAAQFARTLAPGIYTFVSGQTPRRFAVNLDPAESRTVPLSVEQFERLGVPLTRQEGAEAREAQRQVRLQDAELENRQKLWRWCLVAALAVLLVETWLAGRTSATKA